jgi:predicted nucleotidyltransferase
MPAVPGDAELLRALEGTLPEAVAVYLYGSLAAGQAGPRSDVDLAVLAAEPIAPERLARAREALAEALRRDVDVVDLRRASTVMRAQVVSTGRLLRDADPSYREAFETTVYSAYARLNEERRGILERIRDEGRVHGR